MNPYFLMVVLYFSLAALAAMDASLAGFDILPGLSGLRWLRVHFITLGALAQAVFGLLPSLVAARLGHPRPQVRWKTWIALNAGLLTLLAGIPLYNAVLVISGGMLVFIAAVLLIVQLGELRSLRGAASPVGEGRKFYLAGLGYFLLGILIGSGLWFGWGAAMAMAIPLEVHIHANLWGFTSLVFAGLLVDLYPRFAARPLAWPWSIRPIFWLMTLGALLLVLGPWLGSNWLTGPGLVLHLTATFWMLLNIVRPILGNRPALGPGIWHLVTAYGWILAMVLAAPLILLKVPGFPPAGVESTAPQALVYGWVLQFSFALIPYLFHRWFLPDQPAKLGGSYFSLAAAHLGTAALWASLFIKPLQGALLGTAYALLGLSMLPILFQLGGILQAGAAQHEKAGGW